MYYINIERTTKNRYDFSRFLEYVEGGFDIFTSYFMEKLLQLPETGTFTITNEEARMDLVSYRIYGYVQLQFILMIYNNIIDRYNLVIGDTIKYPNINDVEKIYFALPSKQYALDNNS